MSGMRQRTSGRESTTRRARFRLRRHLILFISILLLTPQISHAYSVLTHESIIDAAWDPAIKPLLLARYPQSTPDNLREAKSYAYGGCIIQDMGYYPFGSFLFTDLLHYVRSGDFVSNLLRDAQTEDEYAFALGAMAHYFADTIGHSNAINVSVPVAYPKLRRKYGNWVTYAEGKKEHLLVEFSFDVMQVAAHVYAPQAYHDFIGFQVAKPLLERAFRETYGLDMNSIFLSEDLAIGTYRHAVSDTIPDMTRVAWSQKHREIERLVPGVRRTYFVYALPRKDFNRDFGKMYRRRSFATRLVVVLLKIVPKIGPFRALSFNPPTPMMESWFQNSFNLTVARYGQTIQGMESGPIHLTNVDLDTGRATLAGEYSLADATYSQLLDKLADQNFRNVSSALRDDILNFYAHAQAPPKEPKRWMKTQDEVSRLQAYAPAAVPTQAK